jgi:hypothetical protein
LVNNGEKDAAIAEYALKMARLALLGAVGAALETRGSDGEAERFIARAAKEFADELKPRTHDPGLSEELLAEARGLRESLIKRAGENGADDAVTLAHEGLCCVSCAAAFMPEGGPAELFEDDMLGRDALSAYAENSGDSLELFAETIAERVSGLFEKGLDEAGELRRSIERSGTKGSALSGAFAAVNAIFFENLTELIGLPATPVQEIAESPRGV